MLQKPVVPALKVTQGSLPRATDRFREAYYFADLFSKLEAAPRFRSPANWLFGAHLMAYRGIEDACEPITGDSVRHRGNWKEMSVADLVGTTVKLRIHLTASRLYAFQFVA